MDCLRAGDDSVTMILRWLATAGNKSVQCDSFPLRFEAGVLCLVKATLTWKLLLAGIRFYIGEVSFIDVIITLAILISSVAVLSLSNEELRRGDNEIVASNGEFWIWALKGAFLAKATAVAIFALTVAVIYELFLGTWVGYVALCGDLALLSLFSALPYWALDHIQPATGTGPAVGWTLYFIECVDLVSLCLGFVTFHNSGHEDSWANFFQASFYFLTCAISLLMFANMNGNVIAIVLARFSNKQTGHEVFDTDMYKFVVKVILYLDLVIDVPVVITTGLSGAYVRNAGLTLNLLANITVLLRATYVGITTFHDEMHPAQAREGDVVSSNYIQII